MTPPSYAIGGYWTTGQPVRVANWQSHLAAIDSVSFLISVVVVVDGELDVEPDGELLGSSPRGVDHVLRHADDS